MSASCGAASIGVGSHVATSMCQFMLSDGRRFRCSGTEFSRSRPTPSALEHARGCVALAPLVIPASERAVITALESVRTCMTGKGLRVSGGPVFPEQSPTSADGELIVGNGAGGAFIAFYTDSSRAQRLEPLVRENAARFGGKVERRGAVTVLWIRRPAIALRKDVLACAFA